MTSDEAHVHAESTERASTVATALALSRRVHEAVEAVGIPDLEAQWRERIDSGVLDERIAARLIAVGAVYPSDALVWAAAHARQLVMGSAELVELVADDPALAGHGLRWSRTLAETLGRDRDISVETAKLLVDLLDRAQSGDAARGAG